MSKHYRITMKPEQYVKEEGNCWLVIDTEKRIVGKAFSESGARSLALDRATVFYPAPQSYIKTWKRKVESYERIMQEERGR